MTRKPTWLLDHMRNVYSQTGEDGVIEKILQTIPNNDKWCVEFGASDGMFVSNTRNLIENFDYSAVLIESCKIKFSKLQQNYFSQKNVMVLNTFVGFNKNDGLDKILSNTPVPFDFDLLSIDIDGNDYHVWKAISNYKPKVIVIEFNPTIPTQVRFVQAADPSINQGSSLSSIVELAKEKGYELISTLPFNAFFVRSEYFPLFQIGSNAPDILRFNQEYVTYLFSGFDGQIYLHGSCTLPWHGIKLKESRFQRLPRFLRKYPCNYTFLQKVVYKLFLIITDPNKFIKETRIQKGKIKKV